ncbi:MAG TPA: methylated-DNA--[protein]-cysteine S-methyltransferase [Candidatus Accumulibacter phosphatis]|nr:methylated-DNA--[protein]-cysteine S-methyltransferase [Candidatus Accumulibacter phosphatis]HRQ93597.1 methylated-DNA--[protein]-cysteine S-methyltransferase [Candidatus Accumulibacter phosphatis]
MSSGEPGEQSRNFAVVARAIEYISANARGQPTLEEIAAAVHLSPFHLQRLFSAWAGISPKRFLQYLTKEHARRELARSRDVLTVAADSGLSSGSRLHELMVSCEALSPGEIRAGGRGITISCGFAPSPFGDALIAWSGRGVCHLAFCSTAAPAMIAELVARWPAATICRDDEQARVLLATIFPATPTRGRLHLLLRGTNFQIKVWEALMRVEAGTLVSYGELAWRMAAPNAQRAVGSALAANSIAYLIPCHRVIRESGEIGNYRWGSSRKLAMIGREAALGSLIGNGVDVGGGRTG